LPLPTAQFSRTRFRELRLAANVSLPRLAADLYKSYYTVDAYERGTVTPPTHMLPALAHAFRCEIGDFFAEPQL
jgi:transcriptional regulator with XRE-family HTH domain